MEEVIVVRDEKGDLVRGWNHDVAIETSKNIRGKIDLVVRAYGHGDLYTDYPKQYAYFFDYPYKDGLLRFGKFLECNAWIILYITPDNFKDYKGSSWFWSEPEKHALFLSNRGRKNPIIRKGPWWIELKKLSIKAKEFIEAREGKIKRLSDDLIYEETDI